MRDIDSSFYEAQSTMQVGLDSYIKRLADAELDRALLSKKYAVVVVFSSRKVGKSSLLERSFARLEDQGVQIAMQELSVAKEIDEEGWYLSLVRNIVNDAESRNPNFKIEPSWEKWWKERDDSPAQRFFDFLSQFILEPTKGAWVIAIDEIDTTLPLSFSDDFFATIRRCQNARARKGSPFRRLTFLLAGVTTPAQLIKDNRRTPFNIGHEIILSDFTAKEARTLLRGLDEPEKADHPALKRILDWTDGHPFLTHKIFAQLAEDLEESPPEDDSEVNWRTLADAAAHQAFLRPGMRTTQTFLEDIARRRIGDLSERDSSNYNPGLKRRILRLYLQALEAGKNGIPNQVSDAAVELKLCGLLKPLPRDPSKLIIRNKIFETVFDREWAESEIPRDQWRTGAAVAAAVAAVAIVSAIVISINSRKDYIADLADQIERAVADIPITPYDELRAIRGQEENAQQLLAAYWARQAWEVERETAAIWWLTALDIAPNHPDAPMWRRQTRRALHRGLDRVESTIHQNSIGTPIKTQLSPDGSRILVVSGGVAAVWNAATGDPIHQRLGKEEEVIDAAFSLDGNYIATATNGPWARIFHSRTGKPFKPIRTLDDQPDSGDSTVRQVLFDPSGGRLLTVTRKILEQPNNSVDLIKIWDMGSGQQIGETISASVTQIVGYSPKGNQLLIGSEDSMELWDLTSHSARWRSDISVKNAWFNASGDRILLAVNSPELYVLVKGDGERISFDTEEIEDVTFTPDGRHIVCAYRTGDVHLRSVETGEQIGEPMRHGEAFDLDDIAVGALGDRLYTASDSGGIWVWNLRSRKRLGEIQVDDDGQLRGADPLKISRDGRRLLVTANPLRTYEIPGSGSWIPNDLMWSKNVLVTGEDRTEDIEPCSSVTPDGERVLLWTKASMIEVWDATNKKLIRSVDTGLESTGLDDAVHFDQFVPQPIISPSGKRFALNVGPGVGQTWSARTGLELGTAIQLPEKDASLIWNRQATNFLMIQQKDTETDTFEFQCWDAKGSKPLWESKTIQIDDGGAFEFTPDGQKFVVLEDGFASIYEAQTGNLISNVEVTFNVQDGHDSNSSHFAAFNISGNLLAISSSDNDWAQIWDWTEQKVVGTIVNEEDGIGVLEFTKEGNRIYEPLFGGGGMWDTQTGRQFEAPNIDSDMGLVLAINSDGSALAYGNFDGAVTWVRQNAEANAWEPYAKAWLRIPGMAHPVFEPGDNPNHIVVLEAWSPHDFRPRVLTPDALEEEDLPQLQGGLEHYLKRFSLKFESLREEDGLPTSRQLEPRHPMLQPNS